MPVNPGIHYQNAEAQYLEADSPEEQLQCLQKMLSLVPRHKSSEKLQKEIKTKIAKLKYSTKKEKDSKKGGFQKISIKKEGAALICIVGPTNTGKSTLLNKLTNARAKVANYEFTTKKPTQGILDYQGIKLQLVELPAIVKNLTLSEDGPALLGILNHADLMIYMFNNPEGKKILDKELANVKIPKLVYNNQENFEDLIWKSLKIVKVYTKQPGKPKDLPPIALEKNSNVRDLAEHVHKDFKKNLKYAVINGPSGKFANQRVGLTHKLKDNDVVEFHTK